MRLGLLICTYDMSRELPRTIYTLSRSYQQGVDNLDYEIVILDNGSHTADESLLRGISPNVRVINIENGSPSPVAAINAIARSMDCSLIGIFIDGARMASPRLLAKAVDAHRLDTAKVIGTIAFHIGPDVHMRAHLTGYDQHVEDRLLERTPWRSNGYTLFDISTLAGSSSDGWFGRIAESNAVFMAKSVWDELGGFDERFVQPGGGFCNLEFWGRAVRASHHAPFMILGEATFHQFHGGVATSGSDNIRIKMHEEYQQLTGASFVVPEYTPCFVGELDQQRLSAGLPRSGSARKVFAIKDRSFSVSLDRKTLHAVQVGTLRSKYKGSRFCKNPFDIAIYMQLIERLRPRTIIEIGTSEGGSSLWFKDQCAAFGLFDTRIIGVDLVEPVVRFDGFQFFFGDSTRPHETFPSKAILDAPKPWLIVEDSAHTYEAVSAVLEYFRPIMSFGDYVVVEDGVVADLSGEEYDRYQDGPNRAVAEFLADNSAAFAIDETLCDAYGRNVTYCPNAWLRCVKASV